MVVLGLSHIWDKLMLKCSFRRAVIAWSVSRKRFPGEQQSVTHRGTLPFSPRKVVCFFKESAYSLEIYTVLCH